MNLIDVIIIIWLLAAVSRGYAIGLIRQVLSFAGFLLGLALGGWLAPLLLRDAEGSSRLLVAVLMIVVLAAVFAGTAEGLGVRLQRKLKVRMAHIVNSIGGVVVGMLFVLASSWLIASALTRLPLANLSLALEQSAIIQTLNKVMPSAPGISDRLGQLLTPYGFPEVFVGSEPELEPVGSPTTPEVDAAVAKASGSTVRIEGFACGGISTGSGYVAAPHYVVTNAHVVAGVGRAVVLNQGQRHLASVVWFDPVLDFAVVRTDKPLPGTPLVLDERTQPRGTSVAVLGYPGGGSLKVSPAVVLRSQPALGRDIYGDSLSAREIYALQADIAPGNSGGPVVTAEGSVAGVIFGEAATMEGIGYAITSQMIADSLSGALTRTAPVSSGMCMEGF